MVLADTLKFVDKYFFKVFAIILGLFKIKKKSIGEPKKILIIKIWAIGDAVNLLPMIKALKKAHPKAEIDILAAKENELVFKQPFISKIIVPSKKTFFQMLSLFRKYDVCIDAEPFINLSAIYAFYCSKYRIGFLNQRRSRLYDSGATYARHKHIVENYFSIVNALNIKPEKKLVELKYSENSMKKAIGLLRNHGINNNDELIGICASVGNTVKSREWPKENFRQLSKNILQKTQKKSFKTNTKIILVGVLSDFELNEYIKDNNPEIINLSGILNLEELFYVLKKCKLFISNDTGPMHIAAAQGTKTIGLFGPNTPKRWAPYGKKNVSVCNGVVCKYHPCIINDLGIMPECYYKGTKKEKQCMKAISVNEVLKHV